MKIDRSEREIKGPNGWELTGELVEDKERIEVPQLEPARTEFHPQSANQAKKCRLLSMACRLMPPEEDE